MRIKKVNKMSVEAFACACTNPCECLSVCNCDCYDNYIDNDASYGEYSPNRDYTIAHYYDFQTVHHYDP